MVDLISDLFLAPPRRHSDPGGAFYRRDVPSTDDGSSVASALSSRDAALLVRLRVGDAEAYEALFREHYHELFDFAAAWCHAWEQADEIVSDVFLWLYEHRETIHPRTSLAAYLFGAVRHRALNLRRGDSRAQARHTHLAAESHASVMPQPSATPEDVLLARETHDERVRAVVRALEPLSQVARSIFLLRLQSGMSYAEIAGILGISANSAKTQFSRAMAVVRAAVAADGRDDR